MGSRLIHFATKRAYLLLGLSRLVIDLEVIAVEIEAAFSP